jgi:hypothetical protein
MMRLAQAKSWLNKEALRIRTIAGGLVSIFWTCLVISAQLQLLYWPVNIGLDVVSFTFMTIKHPITHWQFFWLCFMMVAVFVSRQWYKKRGFDFGGPESAKTHKAIDLYLPQFTNQPSIDKKEPLQ